MAKARKLRAIDLYSGVGGWSLGLKLAGIDVVASYERWGPANETNFKNNRHQAQSVDIRRLELRDLPQSIDIVVGSPPCTQFSFSNRGGGGDIADGLQDIIKFLTVVEHLKPTYWVMENVPRLASILGREFGKGGKLARFRHLKAQTRIINMEDFGVPQRRRRCIAGNINFDLLDTYIPRLQKVTMGDVIKALTCDPVVDPLYRITLQREDLHDHLPEVHLTAEEVRINKAAKTKHPVYNAMPFPDRFDRSVRTITATCTRVSRESIIIEDNEHGYRRLTIRERASLQGFPITFQFYGTNHSQKVRMVGNAIPPPFTYYLGLAVRGIGASKATNLNSLGWKFEAPEALPTNTPPSLPALRYPADRRFRFAIPSLRLKSGVRFELCNNVSSSIARWRVGFYFGSSKSIQSVRLDGNLSRFLLERLPRGVVGSPVRAELSKLAALIQATDLENMQRLWSHRGVGLSRPLMFLDQLDECGSRVGAMLRDHAGLAQELIAHTLAHQHGDLSTALPGLVKLADNAPLILAGLLVGATANLEILDAEEAKAHQGPGTMKRSR